MNTIVNDDGHLTAYNTDYIAVEKLIARHAVPPGTPFALRGSGGMAKAVASALRDAGFRQGTIVARNEATGRALAESCGYAWQAEPGMLRPAMLVNVTPVGMSGGPEAEDLSFPEDTVAAAETVFDVVALPVETPLIRLARRLGKRVIDGGEVITLQALEQFVLYTGIRPEEDLVRRAAEYARG